METKLNEREVRVLGCLMEKAMATPDYYPLSLNALTNACNQKSNRDPVVDWDETTIQDTLNSLEKQGLINRSDMGRVPKYEETYTRQSNMVTSEAAVLCILLLRGPQTPGAIRTRTERLHPFESLERLQETLDRLSEWGQIRRIERLPGHKESRYMHLLAGEPAEGAAPAAADASAPVSEEITGEADRLALLETRITALSDELADLRTAFESFRRQFE